MITEQIKWISKYFGSEPTAHHSKNNGLEWAEWKLSDYYIFLDESKSEVYYAINDKRFPITPKRYHTIIHSTMPSSYNYFKVTMQGIGIKQINK